MQRQMPAAVRRVAVRQALVDDDDWNGALLLEGSSPDRRAPSLDEALDARHGWIDDEAARLADLVEAQRTARAEITLADLCALKLRYYLLKLVRAAAWFQTVEPLGPGEKVQLLAARGRDEDYAALLASLCEAAGSSLEVVWRDGTSPQSARAAPPNAWWRQLAGWLASRRHAPHTVPPAAHMHRSSQRPHVWFCGNPSLLGPVCGQLTEGCRVSWLWDRFSVGCFRAWRHAGVRQLVCNSSRGKVNALPLAPADWRIETGGIDLTPLLLQWLTQQAAIRGPQLTQLVERIDEHLAYARPDVLVLDEDATPMARAAILTGRKRGVPSVVLQHGAPYVRAGFAPPLADRFAAWGESSRERLIGWGYDPGRVVATGAPRLDPLLAERPWTRPRPAARGLRVLLLGTVPPRDDRPDPVRFHLTTATFGEMLRMAARSVAALPNAELLLRPHPRTGTTDLLRRTLDSVAGLRWSVSDAADLFAAVRQADCVLSCASSAGVEATLTGVPVIELMPPGSSAALGAGWGFCGMATSQHELDALLGQLAAENRSHEPDPNAFAGLDPHAACRVARLVADTARETAPAVRLSGAGSEE